MAVFVRFLQKEFDVVRVKNRFSHDTVEKVWPLRSRGTARVPQF